MNNNTSSIEDKPISSLEEISVQAFIDILNGPHLNTNLVPDLLEFCTNLTPDVVDMSDEIDDYIKDKVGFINWQVTDSDHPLMLEYSKAIRAIFATEVPIRLEPRAFCEISLYISDKSGEEIKNIIIEKIKE